MTHARRTPSGFRCFVDEVQKLPQLLDEVHELIENHRLLFTMTGSSARKLKRGGRNLLAGRALTYDLFPLTSEELGDAFDLERVLAVGTLPALWNGSLDPADECEFLRAYADT